MELTIRETATLLGRRPRTVRAQVARGDLPGVKRDGRWMIPSETLPLGEPQRRSLQAKADSLREAVESALPGPLVTSRNRKSRSVADITAFRLARPVLGELRVAIQAGEAWLAPSAEELERALLALAEATHEFERDRKLAALQRTRRHLGRSAGRLLLDAGDPLADPVAGWLATLETQAIPALSGLLRWASKLPGRAP